ncbi:MAG: AraC family transcriptional regulator [Ferruginibacter sp.]
MESSVSPGDFLTDRLDHYLETHKNLFFPHRHSFYHLVFFTAGAGKHSIDFVNFPVLPGQIYAMVPGQVHDWQFEPGTNGYVINFSRNYISQFLGDAHYVEQFQFFSGMVQDQVLAVPPEEQDRLKQLFELIISEVSSEGEFSNDMIRSALIQLFVLTSRKVKGQLTRQVSDYNSIVLRNFRKMIELHYKNKKLTKEYAAMLYITPNYLNALSKDVMGRPAGELIRDRVILEAKRLLVNAGISISEISNELDFTDNSYFTKFFKKYTGITPEAFRKQFGNKSLII